MTKARNVTRSANPELAERPGGETRPGLGEGEGETGETRPRFGGGDWDLTGLGPDWDLTGVW